MQIFGDFEPLRILPETNLKPCFSMGSIFRFFAVPSTALSNSTPILHPPTPRAKIQNQSQQQNVA